MTISPDPSPVLWECCSTICVFVFVGEVASLNTWEARVLTPGAWCPLLNLPTGYCCGWTVWHHWSLVGRGAPHHDPHNCLISDNVPMLGLVMCVPMFLPLLLVTVHMCTIIGPEGVICMPLPSLLLSSFIDEEGIGRLLYETQFKSKPTYSTVLKH